MRHIRSRFALVAVPAMLVAILAGPVAATARGSLHGTHSDSQRSGTLTIGALYPLTGSQAQGGSEELHGVQTAATLINAAGGVNGRRVNFVSENAPSADAAPGAVDTLVKKGVRVIMGAYGSTISLPASTEAQRDGVIYWESGAVATMITEKGYPNVFRTVTTGNSLGRAAANYAATVVAPRLHLAPRQLRAAVLYANDVYGSSVGRAMALQARALFQERGVLPYNPYHYDFRKLVGRLKAMRPDIVLVAGYVQDAVAFRRETLRQHLHPAAMIGTSSAFCMHAFGNTLGKDALGLFASDKPDTTFSPRALLPSARALLNRASSAYRRAHGVDMTPPALAGFVAGWVLLHEVLPHTRSLAAADIRAVALHVDLPYGSEVNGAGVKFAPSDAPDAGQNVRAISVIWQWQRPGHEYIVYPPSYATTSPRWVPLPGWKH